MPIFKPPQKAETPFPKSRVWSDKTWADIIEHHILRHEVNDNDYRMTFNDEDRLCVTCYLERGYSLPVPFALVDWAEREMRARQVSPHPSHSDQLRYGRGPRETWAGQGASPDPEKWRAEVAHRLSASSGDLTELFAFGIAHLQLDDRSPVVLRDLPDGALAFSYVTGRRDRWELHSGTIEPLVGGGFDVRDTFASFDRRNMRGGGVCEMARRLTDELVEEAQRLSPDRTDSYSRMPDI